MEEELFTDVGQLLEGCRASALTAWRKEYAPHKSADDLLGNDIRAIRIACNVLPAGSVDVMVKIQARRYYAHEVYFWKFLRVSGHYQIL
jgi:hypothetical protein